MLKAPQINFKAARASLRQLASLFGSTACHQLEPLIETVCALCCDGFSADRREKKSQLMLAALTQFVGCDDHNRQVVATALDVLIKPTDVATQVLLLASGDDFVTLALSYA